MDTQTRKPARLTKRERELIELTRAETLKACAAILRQVHSERHNVRNPLLLIAEQFDAGAIAKK